VDPGIPFSLVLLVSLVLLANSIVDCPLAVNALAAKESLKV
jgi:hypothetical protein